MISRLEGNGHELSSLDHCLLWITLAATLLYPTVDSGLTITTCMISWSQYNCASEGAKFT